MSIAVTRSTRVPSLEAAGESELKEEEINFLMGHKLRRSRGGSYLRRSFSNWKKRYQKVATKYLSLDVPIRRH